MNLERFAPALRERTRQKLESDLGAFCRRAWKEIEPKPLDWGWHHELITEYLALAYRREVRRLIITIPPRGLKSRLVNVFFPAWCWVKDPSLSFVTTSYSDSLSEELSVVRRNLLTSRWFRELWPGKVTFAPDQNRREQYQNTAHGQMIATSMTGTMLGKGADFLICDDALSPQQSYSDLERESVNRNFDSTFRSRLNEADRGVIIIICQRLHERDLVGYLLENEPDTWATVSLAMEAEQDEQILFPVSGRVMERKQGSLLHPARFPAKWVEKQKRTIGTYLWSSQYQQRPGVLGGSIFKTSWFRSYERLPEQKSSLTVISLDTAYSIKKSADYSVASVWTAYDGHFYLRFIWRERAEYPKLKEITQALCEDFRPEAVLIEDKGSGQSLLQSLKQETSLPVVGIPVDTDKVSRAHGVTALFESGRVHFPKSEPWLANYLHELELFPASSHDDQVDSTTMALAYLRSRQYGGGILGLIITLKDLATGKRKMPATAQEILAGQAAAQQPLPQASSKPAENRCPPCPNCKNPSTNWMSPGVPGRPLIIYCNQCHAKDGVPPPKPGPADPSKCWVDGCKEKVREIAGAGRYCAIHGQESTTQRGQARQMSKAEYYNYTKPWWK